MEASEPAPESSMLDKLRNMWEFANLMQYIFIFGRAVKIDEDLTIEVLPPRFHALSNVSVWFMTSRANTYSDIGSRE